MCRAPPFCPLWPKNNKFCCNNSIHDAIIGRYWMYNTINKNKYSFVDFFFFFFANKKQQQTTASSMMKKTTLTLISSRSKKLSMMPFLFQMIGGRSVPWIAQVRTALRPTVTVETLIRWSSARLSCTTSVGMRAWRKMIGVGEWEWMPMTQRRDEE